MEEGDEICRVCRSEATPEQPLFHPCKCSGSIRHVHQDCLVEWLSHSGKKYCELCEHPFTFTPVYRQDMPDVLPAKLFLLQLMKKSSFALKIALRAILVSFVWLIVLPYLTIWIWRVYFFWGTNLSQHLSKLQAMKRQFELSKNLTTVFSYNNSTTETAIVTLSDWLEQYKSQLTLKVFLAECFKGQLIDCIVFIVFVAVFLLREWIIQNIPMDQLPEPQQPDNIVQEDDDQAPFSPVATDDDTFSFEENDRFVRAASMPPVLPSYQRNSLLEVDDHQQQPEYRRAMSVEPSFYNNDFTLAQPPLAPRIRHAEAPPFRPILEEEEIPAPPPPMEPMNNDLDNEDEDDNLEEFEGVLEAIGMQGSLWSLAQNSALMTLLIILSLGAAVWMPYLIGMLFIITDIVDLVRVPLALTRLVTDPFVDFLFLICTDYIGPLMIGFLEPLKIHTAISYIFGLITPSTTTTTVDSSINSTSWVASIAQFINETEPMVESAFRRYQSLALGQTTVDRVACISVGYIIIMIVSCWYLTRSNTMATAAFGRTAQEALRHQGIIFKVGMFITLELAVFPLVCGYLLDFSTVPLFDAVSISRRILTTREHPLLSLFLHWFFGTSFMFMFAVLVTVCRDVVRPGVMWFIRDPNDPEFHPIREIVERPIRVQFKKILTSAIIYMMAILIGVGGVVHLVNYCFTGFLPLKWSLGSTAPVLLPVDLVVMQVGLPALVRYVRPKQTMKRIFVKWVAFTCHQLRLTSFMLGGRHPQEEGRLVYQTWSAWLRGVKPFRYPDEGTIENIIDDEVSYIWEGQLLKVPRHDSVEVMQHRRMLVPLDNYTLEPLDMMERRLGHPAARAPGGDELNTVIVYSPPQFKQRLWIFVIFMWISVTVFFCALTMVPMMLGRYIFKQTLTSKYDAVHDIYSFVVGGSIIVATSVIARQVAISLREITRQADLEDTIQSIRGQTKKWTRWTIRWLFFVITFGLLIPMIFGVLVELYFIMPAKQLDKEAPSLELLSIWAYGFVSMNVIHGFVQIIPNNPIRDVLEDVFRRGIHRMKLELCIRRIVAPLFVMSLTAIGFPFITAYINMKITALTNPEIRIKIVQIAYPTALAGFAAYYLIKLGSRIGTRLAQNIREDNYLIGRTLHNLE